MTEDARTVRGIESAVEEANNPLDSLECNHRLTEESINAWRAELCGALSALDTRRCQLMDAAHPVPQQLQTELERGCASDAEHVVDAEHPALTLGTVCCSVVTHPHLPTDSLLDVDYVSITSIGGCVELQN